MNPGTTGSGAFPHGRAPHWTVTAPTPGARKVTLSLDGRPAAGAVLDFLPVPAVPALDRAAGVPAPRRHWPIRCGG